MSDTDVLDTEIGNILDTDENPVLHAPPVEPAPHVLTNHTLAREENGAQCIAFGKYHLTAAQANQVAIELTDAADTVSAVRVKQGFDA